MLTRVKRGTAGALLCVLAACGGAEFDTWARDVCARNDAIDEEAREILPKSNIAADDYFLEKITMLLNRKQELKSEVDNYQPPFSRAPLQNKLSISLNNSIRYLRVLQEQYTIAKESIEALHTEDGVRDDPFDADNVIRELVSDKAAYRVDPREVLMKRQYEKLYAEVRAQLGLEPLGF